MPAFKIAVEALSRKLTVMNLRYAIGLILLGTCFSYFFSSPPVVTEDIAPRNNYGVDVSFPATHLFDPKSYQGKRYDALMEGCFKRYSRAECMTTELGRFKRNIEQPRAQHNYTEVGFKKMKVPDYLFQAITVFYERNKHKAEVEPFDRGYTFTNHWESPAYRVNIQNRELEGGGPGLTALLWDGVTSILEEWCGHKLQPSSIYGIRIYSNNSVLATHVDRLPLVISCIINVEQAGMEEVWPIEVYDHNGQAHNITMEPGDMVLYESASILHGRPFPMNGVAFANVFIHFIPVDYNEMNRRDLEQSLITIHEHEYTLHKAVAEGNIEEMSRIIQANKLKVHERDSNGRQPIHEAARLGQVKAVKLLVQNGADVSALTMAGGSSLWWAKQSLRSSNHEVAKYLRRMGAPEIGEL